MRKPYPTDLSDAEWNYRELTCPLSQHVNTEAEGFVLKAKVHSAKVMDWDAIKTLVQRADEHFSHVSNTCGWTSASVAKTRARSGH